MVKPGCSFIRTRGNRDVERGRLRAQCTEVAQSCTEDFFSDFI
jgi:hypothetical protein